METLTETVAATPAEIRLTQRMINFLIETTKWARFLGIVGYVMVGLMVIAAFFMLGIDMPMDEAGMGSFGSGIMSFMYLIMALLYFFPVHYLYQFSIKSKKALLSGDGQLLESGFEFLKKHYTFIGILTAIAMFFYAIMLLFGIMAGAMFAFM